MHRIRVSNTKEPSAFYLSLPKHMVHEDGMARNVDAQRAVNSSHSADDPRPSSTYLNPDRQTLTFLSACQNQSVIGARGVFDQDPEAMITMLQVNTQSLELAQNHDFQSISGKQEIVSSLTYVSYD
ncbi:hypothetical protein M8C21_000158 [Ambrosia artemisiifolia]|uniref:Uncharacterized protein n=1 Tax=Ambrosia artemisiifolia TaxID=4212 RepID=A0AAD5BU04_AMBAR|nr:hypothetical protein M8C21_000158 [Ambrosia artemisiifolia]